MRSAILQLADSTTIKERREVQRAAVRQLERAEIYLAAVACMELDDRAAQRAVGRLRADLDSLRRHLSVQRSAITD